MATTPTNPISLKRTSPSDSDEGSFEVPQPKKRRFQNPITPPPEKEQPIRAMFDDDPHKLLLRSIALTCQHVGFDSASPKALEAFLAQAETCEFWDDF